MKNKNEYIDRMRHLTKYEKFAYKESEENEIEEKELKSASDLEIHKCLKCKKGNKPHYTKTTGEIPLLF